MFKSSKRLIEVSHYSSPSVETVQLLRKVTSGQRSSGDGFPGTGFLKTGL